MNFLNKLINFDHYWYNNIKFWFVINNRLLVKIILISIQGIGTENPYLQVDGYTFSGKYVAPIGSYLIFEEKKPSGMKFILLSVLFPEIHNFIL